MRVIAGTARGAKLASLPGDEDVYKRQGHTKAASLEKGTYSPEETTGMQNFTYRLNDW